MSQSFISNISKGIKHKISTIFNNPYQKIGLNWLDVRFLKNVSGKVKQVSLFNSTLHITNKDELIHALNEVFIEEVYKVSLPEKAIILDCGANIGLSALYFKLNHPTALIEAFEPDNGNYELLCKNIKSYKLTDTIAHKKAIWKENTTISFMNDGTMGSKIDSTNDSTASKNLISIEAIRLKDLLNKTIHFLKLDIEGAEYEVLKDCKDELCHVENLFIEYHGHFGQMKELNEILNILLESGFVYYIKEATSIYSTPFYISTPSATYDLQLNIFAFKSK